jgi:hypothetical protein
MKKFKRCMEVIALLGKALNAWKWLVIMLF